MGERRGCCCCCLVSHYDKLAVWNVTADAFQIKNNNLARGIKARQDPILSPLHCLDDGAILPRVLPAHTAILPKPHKRCSYKRHSWVGITSKTEPPSSEWASPTSDTLLPNQPATSSALTHGNLSRTSPEETGKGLVASYILAPVQNTPIISYIDNTIH